MRGPIPYKEPEFKRVNGIRCIRPGSQYGVSYHGDHLQVYRYWFDWDRRVWIAVCDRINALCLPHTWYWTPTQSGRWRWIMGQLAEEWAIAANGLVVGGPDVNDRRTCRCQPVKEKVKRPSTNGLSAHGIELEEVA